ncbi:MAG: phage terminase large subunit [Vicinamibacterales bacterium]
MTNRHSRDLAALYHERLAREAKRSLRAFTEIAWPILEPGQPFVSNWHIDLVSEHLEAVTAGEINRLVINMPPRTGKSLLVSTLWPVWEWLHRPSHRWLFVSFSDALAKFHALNRRRVLLSPWYRRHWGDLVQLTRDQATKNEMHNTRRGSFSALSMGSSPIGKGGNRLVLDDPHTLEQVESDVQRVQTHMRFQETLTTRLNDKKRDAIVVVMQRLHEADLSAVCRDHGYEMLVLEALAPDRRRIAFPISGHVLEREEGRALWPAREDEAQLAEIKRTIGSYAFEGQYQQRPVPRAGALFPRDGWAWYDTLPEGGSYVQSWDLAFKDGPTSDFVVGLVAYVVGAKVFLVDRFKRKASFSDTQRAMLAMCGKHPSTREVLVEEAANGAAIVDSLKAEIPGLIPVRPEGGKHARAAAAQSRVEAGQVLLPKPSLPDGTPWPDRLWVQDFIDTCAAFPKGAHDDDVDALSQLLVRCAARGPEPAGLLREPEPLFRPRTLMFGGFPGSARRAALWRHEHGSEQ